ncbi:tyrosine-type recombinase/integrase [Salinicola halophyticus]|uniref:tyrosine-type recombinase/integrase n=1 Tax=Salinicola halophyticus TaxID=1808881 RepID=UPI003F45F075
MIQVMFAFLLRHRFASHFMMIGGSILMLQSILGHQSLAMTMRYAHFALRTSHSTTWRKQ